MATSDLQPADWIALRLLYILMAADPSTSRLPDVQKTVEYYDRKLRRHKYDGVLDAFALLNAEIPYDNTTFANPGVQLTRNVKIPKEW